MARTELTPIEKQQLEDYEQMMGLEAGQLAMAMDNLTDVMALLGQHKIYCRSEKGLRAGQEALDLVEMMQILEKAKGLIQKTLLTLKD